MKKIIVIIFLTVACIISIIFAEGDDVIYTDNRAASEEEIPALAVAFSKYEEDGIFTDQYEYYIWDLNNDGNQEILRDYSIGSGIINFRVECYDTVSEEFSYIDERMMTDYKYYIYKEELYIIATQSIISSFSDEPHVYRPILIGNILSCEKINSILERKIIKSYKDEFDLPLGIEFAG